MKQYKNTSPQNARTPPPKKKKKKKVVASCLAQEAMNSIYIKGESSLKSALNKINGIDDITSKARCFSSI